MQVLIEAERIQARIRELAAEIERDYPPNQEIHMVGVLKGGFMFMADLVRAMSAYLPLMSCAGFDPVTPGVFAGLRLSPRTQ